MLGCGASGSLPCRCLLSCVLACAVPRRYISIEYTQPEYVQMAYMATHEIATHTVHHTKPFTEQEIVGARTWLNQARKGDWRSTLSARGAC